MSALRDRLTTYTIGRAVEASGSRIRHPVEERWGRTLNLELGEAGSARSAKDRDPSPRVRMNAPPPGSVRTLSVIPFCPFEGPLP
jgi:hypothetical protein